ncbi:MAG: DUF1016 N-terminal domain-containing protein [Candidatus Omnitrophota bacterium]
MSTKPAKMKDRKLLAGHPPAQTLLASPLDSSYSRLLTDITTAFRTGLLQAQQLLEYARLETHWLVGRHIVVYAAFPHSAYPLTTEFYIKLSNDLREQEGIEMSKDMLQRSAQFFRNYEIFPDRTPLTWTHYLILMRVTDEKIRLQLERKAIKQGFTVKELMAELDRLKLESSVIQINSAGKLVFERGKPYTYRICENEDVEGKKILAIDCGFGMCRDIPKGTRQQLSSGQIVCTQKRADGEYSLTANNKRRGQNYTYPARVLKIIDGDTLDLRIDLGFYLRLICERVRLRGIDAPEMTGKGGPGAKDFLVKTLSKCPVIVVRTTKASGQEAPDAKEKFGRWLVDVFFLPENDDATEIAEKGMYLNQLMLDEGHAEIYRIK